MATKFYLHNANSTVTGTLPSVYQSTLSTSDKNVDAASVNRSMDTTIGVSQASLSTTEIGSAGNGVMKKYYYTRFISPPLGQTSIAANTWTYNFAALESATAANFPCSSSSQPLYVCLYVWRPSTGAKIATILDGDSASAYAEPTGANAEKVLHGTFSGSAAASIAVGDVLCFEMWFRITQGNNSGNTITVYYDGTTENATQGTTVSNHAAYLSTPETISFSTLTRVTTAKILKYALVARLAKTQTLKYALKKTIPTSKTLKYALKLKVPTIRTVKYAIKARVKPVRILKYGLKARLAKLETLKYKLLKSVPTQRTLKYALRKSVPTQRTLKYAIKARIQAPRTIKYAIRARIAKLQTVKYALKRRLTTQRTTIYGLKKRIAILRTTKYDLAIRLTQQASRTIKYTLKLTVPKQQTLEYKLLQRIRKSGNVSALSFDQTLNQYVDCTNNPILAVGETPASAASYSGWFRLATLPPSISAGICGKGPWLDSDSKGSSMAPYVDTGGTFNCDFNFNTAAPDYAYVNVNVCDGKWHHFVCSNNATGNSQLWLDGIKYVDDANGDYLQPSGTSSFHIGDVYVGNAFNGEIDDIRVYNVQLTSQEVASLLVGQNVTRGLVANWKLDENTGLTCTDSVNGIVGTKKPTGNEPTWYTTVPLPILDLIPNTIKYALRKQIAVQKIVKYGLKATVKSIKTLVYNLQVIGLTRLNTVRTVKYSMKKRVPATTTVIKYSIRKRIPTQKIGKYALLLRIRPFETVKYNLQARVKPIKILKYGLKKRIPTTTTARYALRLSVATQKTIKYNLAARLKKVQTIVYNVLVTGALARIQTVRTVKYYLRARVRPKTTLQYRLLRRIPLPSQYQLKYALRKSIQVNRTFKYALNARLASSSTLKYSMRARLRLSKTIKYSLLKRILSSPKVLYQVTKRVSTLNTLEYNLYARIRTQQTLVYLLDSIIKYTRLKTSRTIKYKLLNPRFAGKRFRRELTGRSAVARRSQSSM